MIVCKQKNDPELKIQIENLREELINNGLLKGFNHPTTIQVSQELDKLLNKCFTF